MDKSSVVWHTECRDSMNAGLRYMKETYFKEEISYSERLPAKIIHQTLSGAECFTPMHWHNEIEVNLMLQGQAEFTVNGDTRLLQPGDYILINSRDIHMGQYPTQVPIGERFQELITIQWDYEFLKRYAEQSSRLRFRVPGQEQQAENVRKYIQSIGRRFIEGGPCFEMEITADMLRLGSILLKYFVVSDDQLSEVVPSALGVSEMQKAVAYIEQHFTQDITLESISEYMNLSPNYFSKRFRQMTGVTFRDYLRHQRLKSATGDLLSTEKNIAEIAFENGFPNVKAFIEGFRKMYQITPEKYRREKTAEDKNRH